MFDGKCRNCGNNMTNTDVGSWHCFTCGDEHYEFSKEIADLPQTIDEQVEKVFTIDWLPMRLWGDWPTPYDDDEGLPHRHESED